MAPLIGITTNVSNQDNQTRIWERQSYIDAVAHAMKAIPVLIPSIGSDLNITQLVAKLDGIILTGARSNVAPELYQKDATLVPAEERDAQRDQTTLPLIQEVLEQQKPLLAICRGFQELNVALGGSLYTHLKEVPQFQNHNSHQNDLHENDAFDLLYHDIHLSPDGLLHQITQKETIKVNSLHNQGIDRLSQYCQIEATAPDGVIEAARVTGAHPFTLGTQFHPEWKATEFSERAALFKAFAEAAQG